MSWFDILRLLGGDKTAAAAGADATKPAAPMENSPAPDPNSSPQDLGSGAPQMGVKHGMLDQTLRTMAVISGFSRGGVQGGFGMLDYFNKQDQMKADALSKAAAEGLTVEQAQARYPDINFKGQERGSPNGLDRFGQPIPSGVVDFPSSPADLEAARVGQFRADRSQMGFQETPQTVALAQRENLPMSYQGNNIATEQSLPEGGFSPGQYEVAHTVGPQGQKIAAQTLDPLSRSYSYEAIDAMQVPPRVRKALFPDESVTGDEPPRAFVKMITSDGRSMTRAEIAMRYAQMETDPQKQMEVFNHWMGSKGASESKPGTFGAFQKQIENEIGRPLDLSQQMELKDIIASKPPKDSLEAAEAKKLGTPTNEEKLAIFMERLKGKPVEGQGTAAPENPENRAILEQQRTELYNQAFPGTRKQPNPEITPFVPQSGPGYYSINRPPIPAPQLTPNAAPAPQNVSGEMKGRTKVRDLNVSEINIAASELLKTQGPRITGKYLGKLLEKTEGSNEQKAALLRSLVDQFTDDPRLKIEIEKAAVAEL